jgi:hypothetical protein
VVEQLLVLVGYLLEVLLMQHLLQLLETDQGLGFQGILALHVDEIDGNG